jgi:hypothetical protein
MARQEIQAAILSACSSKQEMDESVGEKTIPTGETPYSSGSPACVITTACVELCNLDDDCFELSALRSFRDRHVAARPDRTEFINDYYKISQCILEKLTPNPKRAQILASAYMYYVLPAAVLASSRCDEACFRLYRRGIGYLADAAT